MAKAEIVTWPLAVEDALPVGLSAAGLWIIASESAAADGRRRTWLRAGAVIAATGGAAKALWKILVLADLDIAWLQDLLFPCLALGMTLLVAGILAGRRPEARWWGPEVAIAVAAVLAVATLSSSWATALVVARIVAILSATTLSVLLIRAAERVGDRTASVLFVVNLTVTVLLGRLAAIEDQTAALQWVEQLTNTASQGAFFFGAVRLRARAALRPTPTMDPAGVATIA